MTGAAADRDDHDARVARAAVLAVAARIRRALDAHEPIGGEYDDGWNDAADLVLTLLPRPGAAT
jgi:hypothetical protein